MNGKPVRTKHHKEWDKYIRKLSGGLTILKPAKGQWIDPQSNILHEEQMIPVRIACTEKDIEKIREFTRKHYKQIAVMYYVISENVVIHYGKENS